MAAEPYVGQIQAFGFYFAPRGWHLCDGSLLSISEYTALFTLVGTTFGGDGNVTFGIPDLRGRMALHIGQGPGLSNRVMGQMAGVEAVTLTTAQMPMHTHSVTLTGGTYKASSQPGAVATPDTTNNVIGAASDINVTNTNNAYNNQLPDITLNTGGGSSGTATISVVGNNLPFENMEPFLTINYSIALEGIFPSRN